MVRSLWTAATGMLAQQTNVDTIANNLANVNTTGYKTQINEFKSLLYQNLQTKTTSANGDAKPSSAQVGLGVRNASITSVFKTGNFLASESNTAFALDGEGFFAIRGTNGENFYTRNGNFMFTLASGGNMLATTEGLPVLDTNGNPIVLDQKYMLNLLEVDSSGRICYPDESNNPQPIGVQIGVFQFSNPNGMKKLSESRFGVTDASGQAINEATNNTIKKTKVVSGYLEGSNVQVVDEMVNMIVAQRAYEMNSKAITTTDEMMQQANNLKR